jgi:uncharacterized protein YjiS (DUF1127 family)
MTDTTFAKTWQTPAWTRPSRSSSFVSAGAAKLWQTLLTWQRRAYDRNRLAEMDQRLLKDMGITRVDAWRETQTPFWTA